MPAGSAAHFVVTSVAERPARSPDRAFKWIAAVAGACLVGFILFVVVRGPSHPTGAGTAALTVPAPAVLGAGTTAPPFSLPALGGGEPVSLAAYRGTPVIVNFFASWCGPCKKETPLLAGFYRSEHGKVAIVGLDENDVRASAISFTRSYGVGYPVGFDPAAIAASAYGVSALPQTFFLDARHRIVDRVFGAVTLADLNRGIALATGKG